MNSSEFMNIRDPGAKMTFLFGDFGCTRIHDVGAPGLKFASPCCVGYDRDSSLYAELLFVLGERLRRELKAPVMKRLANDWRNLGVVVLGASLKCLVAELGAEAPVQAC